MQSKNYREPLLIISLMYIGLLFSLKFCSTNSLAWFGISLRCTYLTTISLSQIWIHYTNLSAIMAKLTNHVQRTRFITSSTDKHYRYSLDSEEWLLLRLSKHQSPTTVLFRTILTRTITTYKLLILLGSNHSILDSDSYPIDSVIITSFSYSHL